VRARVALAALALAAATGAGVAGGASAQDAADRGLAGAQGPLVYAVVIDGLDGDAVDAGGAPFISSLLAGQGARSTYFEESRAIMPSVTNANHVAMMTGSYAGDSGNPGNEFALYSPLENGDSCVATGPENTRAQPTVTSGESRSCPQAEMVFEAIKRQGNPRGLVTAGVFGKPKLGRIFAGQNVDPDRRDVDYLWAPCASGSDDDEYCGDVPTNPISGYAVDDATVMDEVLRTIEEGVPAGDGSAQPNFTFVNLHQVDSAGHFFGRGPVYDEAVAMADDEIERLVTTLRARGEWERTVLILLSDHSIDQTPTKVNLETVLEDAGVPADAFTAVMGDNGMAAHVYLADRESRDRVALLRTMRDAIAAHPSVDDALYREPNPEDGGNRNTLARKRPEWRVEGERSGDIFVTAKSGSLFASASGIGNFAQGHHGSNSTRDNFFAVIGGGDLVRQRAIAGNPEPDLDDTAQNPEQAENVDVAATVMGLFGMTSSGDDEGRFLKQAFDKKALESIAAPERPGLKLKRKKKRLVVRFVPAFGDHDLQVRDGKKWDKVLKRSDAEKAKIKVGNAKRIKLRARSVSAAGVKSDWTKAKAKLKPR
jgi:hypothetical protein